MTHDDKPQFLKLLAVLFGAYGKPLSESMAAGYWKGLEKMDLGTFERCCDAAIEKLQYAERGVCKTPNVSELWDLRRNMRRLPSAPTPKEPEWSGDHWDIAANHLLLKYITDNWNKRDRIEYCPDTTNPKLPGPQTIDIAKILRNYARQWAQARRADEQAGVKTDGKIEWLAYMSQADRSVTNYLSQHQSAA